MLIQVRVDKSSYFNLGDKNTLRLFDAKDNSDIRGCNKCDKVKLLYKVHFDQLER